MFMVHHILAVKFSNSKGITGASLAEHIGQSSTARVQQQLVNSQLLETQWSARQREVTIWLAPTAYDVDYYMADLAAAQALRHPKTCQWLLDKESFLELSGPAAIGKSLLWIFAKPGAGKTILSSFIIDHYQSRQDDSSPNHVFYFFCKNTDADKNNSTAIIRSLLYQLYRSVLDQGSNESLSNGLGQALEKSGQQRAVNFMTMWQIFSAHVGWTRSAVIVLDGLDECQDPQSLLQGLKSISTTGTVKIITTSRKEAHLEKQLGAGLALEITPEDINADIIAFAEAKVSTSPRLSHPLVRDLVLQRLSNAHGGMFLWVYLMLKELKSCLSVSQVQETLKKLPKGLDGIYKSVLQRLRDNLRSHTFGLCFKVLTWVVTAMVCLSASL